MSLLLNLKAEAAALKAQARVSGHFLKHCTALEQVAKTHGYGNWRACRAALSDNTALSALPATRGRKMTDIEMKRYKSRDWNFSLDIPKGWNAFPAVSTNSPYELIRFASHEDGVHYVIVFRMPYDPNTEPRRYVDRVQETLTKDGFSNFRISETAIGSRQGLMLDCNKAKDGGTWSVREYFIFDGTLVYALGFGTSAWDMKIPLYQRMAESFDISNE